MFYLTTHSTHFIYSVRDMVQDIYNMSIFPIELFLVLHDWCNKGCGMCYPVCGMVHIKEPLLLIDKSSLCGGVGFLFHYQNGP